MAKQDLKIYLSGYPPMAKGRAISDIEKEWLKRTGCKYRCYSFAYVCPGAFYYNKRIAESYKEALRENVGVMMDSGAHSFHNFMRASMGKISARKKKSHVNVEELREETIRKYIHFCKKKARLWDFYVTFDYIQHAPTIYKVTERLIKAGLWPIPVFHGDSGVDNPDTLAWFRRYCEDGHKFIGIGTGGMQDRKSWKKKRVFFDAVFDIAEKYGVKLHGFAQTALTIMFQFPFATVDSATWVKVASFGKILYLDPGKGTIGQIHVSDRHTEGFDASYNKMPRHVRSAIRHQVEDYGFDFDKIRTSLSERCAYNGYLFCNHLHQFKDVIAAGRVQWESLV